MLKGIDISSWQGDVDYGQLSTQFIIIRSSYGTGYTDAKFIRNRDNVRAKGIPHGFYHYAYPTYNTPEAEADWFCSVIGTPATGELLCLDFEEKYPTPVDWCKRFLDRVSSKLNGYKPLIYINKFLMQSYDWKPVVLADYGLWLAYWDYNPDSDPDSSVWSTVALRQYSNSAQVKGIVGNVDANVFYGDLEALKKYGYVGESVPDNASSELALCNIECQKLTISLAKMTADRDKWNKNYTDLEQIYLQEKEDNEKIIKEANKKIEALTAQVTMLQKEKVSIWEKIKDIFVKKVS
jgi:GH25 family lysozyme M1 (1,4-beta-N-acetylmuramidase)